MASFEFLAIVSIILTMLAHSYVAQNSPQDYVRAHNAVRAKVGVGPVTWDAKVAAYAQNYANKRKGDCAMVHSSGPYGENLAAGYPNLNGVDAVKMWAGEKPNYNHAKNACVNGECRHYTQVVWRKSVRIGCGRVKCSNGWVFVICSYYPFGNTVGQRPY